MSELLNKSTEFGFKQLKQNREEIIKKWIDSGLLDGLAASPNKINLASLLDGKASCMINEYKKQ
jgi:hypothetical protein